MTTPSIYVADLAAYNNGKLHGAWIDAAQDPEAIREEIRALLAASPEPDAEEWAIHDHEGFEPLALSEYETLATVSRIALAIAEHGEAFAAYAFDVGIDHALNHFEEAYLGAWDSEEEFAAELFDELYLHAIPVPVHGYIDYERFANDLFLNDYTSQPGRGGVVHVFDRHV